MPSFQNSIPRGRRPRNMKMCWFRRDILDRLVVIRLNGGLGTTMGCSGPKSFIEVKEGMSFLDIAVRQHKVGFQTASSHFQQTFNERHKALVPLYLMNSFYTDEVTEPVLEPWIRTFNQVSFLSKQHRWVVVSLSKNLRWQSGTSRGDGEWWSVRDCPVSKRHFDSDGILQDMETSSNHSSSVEFWTNFFPKEETSSLSQILTILAPIWIWTLLSSLPMRRPNMSWSVLRRLRLISKEARWSRSTTLWCIWKCHKSHPIISTNSAPLLSSSKSHFSNIEFFSESSTRTTFGLIWRQSRRESTRSRVRLSSIRRLVYLQYPVEMTPYFERGQRARRPLSD